MKYYYYFDEDGYCNQVCNCEDIENNNRFIVDEYSAGDIGQMYDFKNKLWLNEFKQHPETLESQELSVNERIIRDLEAIKKVLNV